MDRLGPAMDDNALAIEQNASAWSNLKAEVGMALAGVVGGSSGAIGKFTGQWSDNLRVMRENSGEIGILQGNLGMLGDALGFNSTVFDKFRDAEQLNFDAAAKGVAAMAQGFSDVGASAPPAISAIEDMGDAADNAQAAFFDAAAGLDAMSTAAFVQTQLDALAQLGLAGEDYVAAQEALLRQFGLLTEAEVQAQGSLGALNGQFAAGLISLETYRTAVGLLKSSIDGLESKEIGITMHLSSTGSLPQLPQSLGVGYTTDYRSTLKDIEGGMASGGFAPIGTNWLVGEQGPEMMSVGPMGTNVTPMGGAGGSRVGSTWSGDININGVTDPGAVSRAVVRSLQDRGMIPAGGTR